MEEPNSKQLAQIAQSTSDSAHEAAKITQDIMLAIKVENPTLKKMRDNLACFADHCRLLSLQLSDPGGLQGLVAKEMSGKYWKCVHDVLSLWQKHMNETVVERLRKNEKLRAGPTGWILPSHILTNFNPRMWPVEGAAESYLQDAQLVTALLNLLLTSRNWVSSDSGHHLEFLSKDLERKAWTVLDRVSRLRKELKLGLNWSGTQIFIAEIAMETVMEINSRAEGSDQGFTISHER